jgi:hypothetical protein
MTSDAETSAYASPACFAHEVDPVYMGGIPDNELAALLNLILEVERAGAKALTALLAQFDQQEVVDLLSDVQRDHARFCGRLTRIVTHLGGTPSEATSAFHDEIVGLDGAAERLNHLISGQNWVINQIETVLPRVPNDDHHATLADMRDAHRRNVTDCGALLNWMLGQR